MTLYLFLVVSILVHVSLQYFFIPRLKAGKPGGQKTFKMSASLAVLKYLSTTSLLASVTYTLIVILVLALSLTKPVTSAEFGAAIANIQWIQSKYKIFRDFWTLWLFLMILLAYVAYRRGKKAAAREDESARHAAAEAAREPSPPLPPNEEMEEIMRKLDACGQRAKRLEQSWVRSDEELTARLKEFEREAEGLRAKLREADARRHARPAPATEAQPTPRESSARLRRVFASKGFFKTLEGTTRTLGYVGTVLLVLCVVGVNAPVLHRALANRVLHLNELQVEASKDEALRSFAKVMAEEDGGGPRQLSEEDHRAINETARLFEQAFTSSKVLRQEKDKEDDDKARAVFVTRCRLTRDQIVADFRRNPPGSPNPSDGVPPGGPKGPNSKGPGGRGPDDTGGPSGPRGGKGGSGGDNKTGAGRAGGDGTASDSTRGGTDAGRAGDRMPERPNPPAPPAGGAGEDLRTRLVSDDRGPRTKLGQDFAAALEKELTAKPRLLEKLKSKLSAFKASFDEPFEPQDFGKFAFGEAFGYAVDKSWQAPDEIAGQFKKVGQTAFKDAAKNLFARTVGDGTLDASVRRMFETLKCRFVSDVAGEASFDDMIEHVQEGLPEKPLMTDEEAAALREVAAELPRQESLVAELADSYKASPPALPYNEAERAENETAAARLSKTLEGRSGRALSAEEIKLVDSYEDHYPGRLGSESDTPKGRLLASSGKTTAADQSQNLLSQSRDFSSLKQSVDVGGILMGRSPEPPNDGGDFTDLRWRDGDGGLTIFIRRDDGSEVAAGPFEKPLVHQALGYVADDRKVVVTIISGGRGRRRVMLHPALVDTRLGQDIVEFDKLVFRFMNNCDPARKESDQLIDAQLSLYDVAHALRSLSVLRQLASYGALTDAGRKDLSMMAEWESKGLSSGATYELLKPGLLDAENLDRPEKSILAWGKAFFDQTLVREIKRCASQSRDHLPAFHLCLSESFSNGAYYASEDTLKGWLKPPPTLSWRSIAEELPYRVDPDLSLLNSAGDAGPAERLWPFQFRYEIAFPADAPYRANYGASDGYRTPWEFAALRGAIAEKVWNGVDADAGLRSLYKRVRDFTVLQRLFRASLEGGLGQRFPVEKLVLLTRATAGSLANVATPRWDDLPARKCN
jgi:hypothetical protein